MTEGTPHDSSEDSCAAVSNPDRSITSIVRDGTGAPSYILGPYGQRTDLEIDTSNGYLKSITSPPGATASGPKQQFTYSDHGLMLTAKDPNNDQTSFDYTDGRLTARLELPHQLVVQRA